MAQRHTSPDRRSRSRSILGVGVGVGMGVEDQVRWLRSQELQIGAGEPGRTRI